MDSIRSVLTTGEKAKLTHPAKNQQPPTRLLCRPGPPSVTRFTLLTRPCQKNRRVYSQKYLSRARFFNTPLALYTPRLSMIMSQLFTLRFLKESKQPEKGG